MDCAADYKDHKTKHYLAFFSGSNRLEQQQKKHVNLYYVSSIQMIFYKNSIQIAWPEGWVRHCQAVQSDLLSACEQKHLLSVAAPPQAVFHRYPNFPEKRTFLQSTGAGRRQEQLRRLWSMLLARQAGGCRILITRMAVHSPLPQPATTVTHAKQGPLSPTDTQGAAWGQSDSKQGRTETLLCATSHSGAKSFLASTSMSNDFWLLLTTISLFWRFIYRSLMYDIGFAGWGIPSIFGGRMVFSYLFVLVWFFALIFLGGSMLFIYLWSGCLCIC